MKASVRRAIREEKGNVLILALILLVVGGLILGPLLGLMGTGLVAGQVYERKTAELYAADAGIEDALWKIKHGIEIPTDGYNLTVNDKYVWVTIVATGAQQFLVELLDLKGKNWGHSEWIVLGRIQEPGEAAISISWNGSGNEWLTDVGIWLSDTCSYVEGQAIPTDDIRNQYPFYTFQQKSFGGGTAFIWTWDKQNAPSSKDTPAGTLTFEFTPKSTPALSIAFTMTTRQDVGLSYDGSFNLHKITAIAISDTGTATADLGTQTTIVAHATASGCQEDEITILSWSIG